MMTLGTLFNQIKIYGYIKAETVNDSGKELKHIEYDRKDGTHYFVRFTVQELKSRIENNQFHDVFVSDVKLYDKKAVDELNLPDSKPGKHLNTAFDKILAQALREIKKQK